MSEQIKATSKIFITGGSGFLGKTLIDRFKAEYVVNYDIIEGFNVLDEEELKKQIEDTNPVSIIHFASPSSQILFKTDPKTTLEIALRGALNVLKYSRDIPVFIPSTSSLYGVSNNYAISKLFIEELKSVYPNLKTRRIFAGYGENEIHKGGYASIVYQWLKAVKEGRPIEIWGDGTQSRDFVYQEDIIDQILKGGVEDIGTGISTTFNEVLEIIKEVTNIDPIVIYKDKSANYLKSTKSKVANCKTTLKEGIEKVWNALNSQN